MPRFKPYMYVPQPFQKKLFKKKQGDETTEKKINRFQVFLVAPWVQHSVLGNQRYIHYHMWYESVAVSNGFQWLVSYFASAFA